MNQIPKIEKKILKFWQKENIFAKSVKLREKRPFFSFFDGPPFASGLPHYGHILASAIKDTVLRYWAMKGYRISWRVGWDCHGLPVENMIEKEVGLKNKKEIEEFGIEKFNTACQSSVFKCTSQWVKTLNRVGRWFDNSNPYSTMDNNYIESSWWVFKKLWEKGLVYQDYRVTPYCPRCGTPLSNFELNQPGAYRDVKEGSVYIKLLLKGEKNVYLLAWTTTPWTLPANTALAVGTDIKYVKAKLNNDYYILAQEKLGVLGKEAQIEKEFLGKELLGKEYQPLYKMKLDKPGYLIVPADFVSTEEGTGIVHIAPAFGEEDMELGKKEKLPTLVTVDEEGKMIKNLHIPGEGLFVKKADKEIKEDLAKRGFLFKEEEIIHSYPHCWRCDSPLLYFPINSWYVAVSKIKKELISNNEKIRWVPSHLKHGRFGKWLEGARDWAISRNRYWGAPIPVWQCSHCGEKLVAGSLEDLKKNSQQNNKYFLLRHGETQNNINGIIYSDEENRKVKITKKAEEKIKEHVPFLQKNKIDLIFSSDFYRTKQTASIIAKALGSKIIYDKRLRDMEVGQFKGKSIKEYNAYFDNDQLKRFNRKPFQAESLSQLKRRMMNFLLSVEKKYQNKNILIVSHGDPLWVLNDASQGFSNQQIADRRKKSILNPGELKKLVFKKLPFDKKGDLNLHLPYIDRTKVRCPVCGKEMKRTSEVFDCWFESGSMPYGQWHYPFENKKLLEKTFPAHFIAEGIDQTRGWFYTLHVLASALTKKDSSSKEIGLAKEQPAFKNVVVNGFILGEDGKKLSKRLRNYTPPEIIFDQYGADTLRYFLLSSTPMGEDCVASEKKIAETFRRFVMTLWNCFIFLNTYAPQKTKAPKSVKPKNILDSWIISKLNSLNAEVANWMDKYDLTKASRSLDLFLDDFSNWYVRRSRRRFQKPQNNREKKEAEKIYSFVLLEFSKLAAPFIPFLTEEIYQHLGKGESVHLCSWPKVSPELINQELEIKMGKIRELSAAVLAQRAAQGIKVRQPLRELKIKSKNLSSDQELLEIFKEEINVKKIVYDPKIKGEIELDTKITSALQQEGMLRDLIRYIQEMRKNGNLRPSQLIYLRYTGQDLLERLIQNNLTEIKKEISASQIENGSRRKEAFLVEKEISLNNQKIWLGIKSVR